MAWAIRLNGHALSIMWWRLACVYRSHQIPPFPRLLFQRRTPASMSARRTKSMMNVERTTTLARELRINTQIPSIQCPRNVTTPDNVIQKFHCSVSEGTDTNYTGSKRHLQAIKWSQWRWRHCFVPKVRSWQCHIMKSNNDKVSLLTRVE